jgi:hypothetical protein
VAKPVYSGLFLGGMDDETFSRTVDLALGAGAAGLSLFADDMVSDAQWQILRRRAG